MTPPLPLPRLPALDALPALREALRGPGRAVLSAPPGSGKTTLLPLALLDEPWLAGRRVLMLEPRRVAARAAAARMAQLLGEPVGETVGYRVRFERRVSVRTRVEVLTEGLLTRRLQEDPELPGTGLVIFDEFHERSLDADLALALCLDAREAINPALRVLVMSATLDAGRIAGLLGGAPCVSAGGRPHPVELRYRPPRPGLELEAAVAAAAQEALEAGPGDVLAFLPGAREIRRTRERLEARTREVLLAPLYGELSGAAQDAALRPAADGRRKIILATNIAQTSLTVEGVRQVVDGGYVRAAQFDLGAGADRLVTRRVSRASAEQRAGRAGRLGPGIAWRLWSEDQQAKLPAHDEPEIRSADLTRFALELAAWGLRDVSSLALLDAPPEAAWSYARELLRRLDAIDGEGRVTAHGRELLRLPASPRLAHLLCVARGRDAVTAAWLAALLEMREAGPSELAARLRQLRAGPAAGRAEASVRQFSRLAPGAVPASEPEEEALGRLVAEAFPERIARRREGQDGIYICADGGEARLPAGDPLAREPWLAIAHWDPAPPRRIRLAAPLTEADAQRVGQVESRHVVCWDPRAEAVQAETQVRLGAILLSAKPLRDLDPQARIDALLDGLRKLGLEALPWDEDARQWRARVASLGHWRKDEAWPAMDDASLVSSFEAWLAPFLDGISRREQLARLDLQAALASMLDYERQRALERLAPGRLPVPSGSLAPLRYSEDGAPPVLSVKLQEMFGCSETPRVNEGRLPVLLHLLSPARRPIAVTQDLAGFWRGAYADVRRDLRGRYPKHPWPDDPLQAVPTARAKPRGR